MDTKRNNQDIIGQRIKSLREKKGLTQGQLSAELHIGRSTISQWESGLRLINVEDAIRLADYFGVSCDFFFRGVEARNLDFHGITGLSDDAIEALRQYNLEYENQSWNESSHYMLTSNIRIAVINAMIQDSTIWKFCEEYIRFKPIFQYPSIRVDSDNEFVELDNSILRRAFLYKITEHLEMILENIKEE